MAFIVDYAKDWALDTASGYLKTGIQAGGTLAGNAVGGVGSTLENGGRAFGEGTVTNGIRGVGDSVNNYGHGIRNAFAADGPTTTVQTVPQVTQPQAVQRVPAAGAATVKSLPPLTGAPRALPSAGGAARALPAGAGQTVGASGRGLSAAGGQVVGGGTRALTTAGGAARALPGAASLRRPSPAKAVAVPKPASPAPARVGAPKPAALPALNRNAAPRPLAGNGVPRAPQASAGKITVSPPKLGAKGVRPPPVGRQGMVKQSPAAGQVRAVKA